MDVAGAPASNKIIDSVSTNDLIRKPEYRDFMAHLSYVIHDDLKPGVKPEFKEEHRIRGASVERRSAITYYSQMEYRTVTYSVCLIALLFMCAILMTDSARPIRDRARGEGRVLPSTRF